MKSNPVSKSESGRITDEISRVWSMELPRTRNLTEYGIVDGTQLFVGNGFRALKIDGSYVPFLSETEMLEKFPSITVDMGAVRFMCKGANVMRPGITKFTEFKKDELVCIKEESHDKFIAVGRAKTSSGEGEAMERGEVLENLHFISDKYWESAKDIP